MLALTIFTVCIAGGAWAARCAARTPPRDDAGWSAHLVTIAKVE